MTDESEIPGATTRTDSVADLLKQLRDEGTFLVKQEIALLKTETSEKVSALTKNAVAIAIGGLVLLLGAVYLVQAVVEGLTLLLVEMGMKEHSLWAAPLIVGALIALIGAVMIQKGMATIKRTSMVPEKSVDSLRKDKEWLQHKAA